MDFVPTITLPVLPKSPWNAFCLKQSFVSLTPIKHSQSPLATYSTTGHLESWRHVGDAVGKFWKHDRQAQSKWEHQKCIPWKIKKTVLHFEHADHHGVFYGLRKRAVAGGGLPYKRRGAVLSKMSPQMFECLQAPRTLSRMLHDWRYLERKGVHFWQGWELPVFRPFGPSDHLT